MARVDYILRVMSSEHADSLRMVAGRPPELFFGHEAKVLSIPPFNPRQMQDFVRELTTAEDIDDLNRTGSAALLYEYEGQLYEIEILNGQRGLQTWFRPYVEQDPSVAAAIPEPGPGPAAFSDSTAPAGTSTGTAQGPLPALEVADIDDAVEAMMARRQAVLQEMQSRGQMAFELLGEGAPATEAFEGNGDVPSMGTGPSMSMERPASAPNLDANLPQSYSHEAYEDFTHLPQEKGTFSVPMHGDGRGGLRPTASIQYTRQEATVPPMPAGGKLSRDEFHRLLRWMVEQDATDMHITPSFPPTLRADGVFQPSQGKSFTPSEVQKVLTSILTEEERRELTDNHSVDLAYGVKGLGRFRINIFRQFHGFSAAVRYIRGEVSNFENLNLPPSLATLANLKTGMLLFTGPTGSGKSTTMATLMELMNRERQLHILTLEAPIEHIFESKKCLIQQREVGTHTDSFSRGLKDALRENPDVIMVGELRDLTTVKMALTASETGHLILATMHANSCGNAISRLVDVFPDTEKAGARAMIAETLQAVVNMRLLRHAAGRGLVPAVELLRINPAAGRTIREGKMHQMKQVLSTGITDGMWPMERNLAELVMENKIEEEEGAKYAAEKSIYHQYVASFRAAMARANAPQEPEKKGFFFR